MPGARLTDRDRELIGSGLAEGLRYTDIARKLDRPTSTISREVARNGGHQGYRAEEAHRETKRRAHRRHANQSASAPAARYGRDPATVRAFEAQFVEMMVSSGLPRMMSGVLSCLLTSDDGSLTASELVTRLRVSPASVSKAVRYLERLELLRREQDTHRQRRERYVVDDNVWYRAYWAQVQICEQWADAARHGAMALGPATPAGARMGQMNRFFTLAGRDMARMAEHWRRESSRPQRKNP